MKFPNNFYWGAASASYQIEGAAFEDGKGLSVWDMMCRKPNAIYEGQNGNVACDHYHRYKEDVALMKEIGLKAYRTSLSWPRILPQGIGTVNQKGLDFYDKLADELLNNNITPFITLFHWDFPYELYCRGGWLNPESSNWFAEYAQVVVDKLSDRVFNWMTLNEPQCFIGQGHYDGIHAPGDKLGRKEMLLAGHNSLLAHGKAVQVIRNAQQEKANIGFAPVGVVKYPSTESPADIEAARKAMFSINPDDIPYWNSAWWMDPVFLGKYPDDGLELFGDDAPNVAPDDMAIISQPVDFCGLNIYNGQEFYAAPDGTPVEKKRKQGFPITLMKWPITPKCLYWGPKLCYERYKKPIIITENGMSNPDYPAVDNKVHDPQRIDFLTRYLTQLGKAIQDGVDIKGYMQWSITDNFEWAEGYSQRFGLIYVDYETQKRTLKDSAYWYQQVIKNNEIS